MKKSVAIVFMIAIASVSVSFAQDETKTKFYDFNDMIIDGNYQKPQVAYTDSKKKVQFEALLSLKRDFIKRVKESSKDASLR
jgi:hypothetical protein